MKKRLSKRIWIHDVVIILIVYLLIHGFMLLLTGTFHDDWLSYFHDSVTKNMEGLESGRPYYSFVIELVWNLPGYGYRILAFITYLASYLCIYASFYNIKGVDHAEALSIALISMAAPVNDARVLLANYPYALGMLLFLIASFLLIRNIKRLRDIRVRLAVLILYFLSFTLNSNLVLYGVIILYLILELKFVRIYSYLDFLLLPIIFFLLNHKLFPVYGAYEKYNVVTAEKLKWTILSLPKIVADTLCTLVMLVLGSNARSWIALVVSFLGMLILSYIRKHHLFERTEGVDLENRSINICIFVFGIVALIAGLFPYVVVRQNSQISFTGIQGRDSIQIGLGIAMMVVGGVDKRIRTGMITFIVVAGILHFNIWYLNYQEEWYRQLYFQSRIMEIDDVKNGGNYIINCSPKSVIGDRRFYTWSGNTAAVTGKKNCFMFNGEGDTGIIEDTDRMKSILSHYPMFSEYSMDHTTIDGKIDIHVDLSRKEVVLLKLYELFTPDQFEKNICSLGEFQYSSAE